jgi:inositol-phosphate phosphatase/L-galactose 1-phosphate phosphatase/histidinol-phosphatase
MQALISDQEAKYYRQTVRQLCDQARMVCSAHPDRLFQIVRKEDESPVTELDRQIELALRATIQSRHPDDSIIGEEFALWEGAPDHPSDRKWVIDPLDGTKAFVTGSPLWGTLIGVLHDGRPWLGAIEMPALGRRFFAPGGRRTGPGEERLGTSACSALAAVRLCTTNPDKFTPLQGQGFRRLIKAVAVHRYGGDCFNYAALATGRCDLVVECGLAPHDFLPIVPIIENAGGIMTDWRGKELTENSAGDVVASSTAALHHQALRMLLVAADD